MEDGCAPLGGFFAGFSLALVPGDGFVLRYGKIGRVFVLEFMPGVMESLRRLWQDNASMFSLEPGEQLRHRIQVFYFVFVARQFPKHRFAL